jgi:hypothetical protein
MLMGEESATMQDKVCPTIEFSSALVCGGAQMIDSKLKRLIEKREAVNARIAQVQNKLRANERRSDTRRKVLAGAAVLEWAKRDSEFSSRLTKELKDFLVRDADRELFGLPSQPLTNPLPKAAATV